MNDTTLAEHERFDAAELGAMMREMRENLGHDLSEVASDLRIRLVYIEAIEAGRLSDLPGSAYVSGFLRAYSDYLGLDGEEIVRRFRQAGVDINSQTRLHLPSPVEEGRLPTGSILLIAAILAAGAYGGWYYFSSQGRNVIDSVAELPPEIAEMVGDNGEDAAARPAAAATTSPPLVMDRPAGPAPTPLPDIVPPSADAAAGPPAARPVQAPAAETASGPAREAPAPPPETPAAAAVPEPAPAPAPAEPDPSPAAAETPAPPPQQAAAPESRRPPAPAEPDGTAAPSTAAPPAPQPESEAPAAPVSRAATVATRGEPAPVDSGGAAAGSGTDRIVVRATADSYVAVLTSDNQPLFSQLMRAGDSYEVPSGADLILETGNAGGLEISVGGRRAPPLGPAGSVRRNIPLDGEKLLQGVQ